MRRGIITAKAESTMATDTTPKRSWIQKTPGVCGGDACIRSTRITVWGLASYRKLGLPDQRILKAIQGLTHSGLRALSSPPATPRLPPAPPTP